MARKKARDQKVMMFADLLEKTMHNKILRAGKRTTGKEIPQGYGDTFNEGVRWAKAMIRGAHEKYNE